MDKLPNMPNFPPTERGIRKMKRWADINIKNQELKVRFIQEADRLLNYIEKQ